MQLKLNEIEITDQRITTLKFDMLKRSLAIVSPSSYYILEGKRFGKTTIIITQWSDFNGVKYVYDENTDETTRVVLKESEEIETFEFIQQIDQNDYILTLAGWSNKTGFWIEYQFSHAHISIEIES